MARLDFSFFKTGVLILVLIFTGGCNEKIAAAPSPTTSPSPLSSPNVVMETNPGQTPTPEETISSYRCKWPPILISDIKATAIYWLPNGDELVFKQEGTGEWFIYALKDGIIKKYDPSIDYTSTPEPVNIQDYVDLFISPDKKTIIYTRSMEGGYRVFTSRKNQSEDQFIGEIQGMIDQAIWIQNGEKLVLSIDWQSPLGAREASVYLINLEEENVTVIIPSTSELSDISMLGVTPDEKQILFTSYSGENRMLRLWNLNNGSEHSTKIYPPWALKWLPDQKTFLGVGMVNNQPILSVYLYNSVNNWLERLLPNEINANLNITDSIQLSPNLNALAYIDEDNLINIIDCNGLAQ